MVSNIKRADRRYRVGRKRGFDTVCGKLLKRLEDPEYVGKQPLCANSHGHAEHTPSSADG
jgi:hypothetical protein